MNRKRAFFGATASKLCCKALLHDSWVTWITSWSQTLLFACMHVCLHARAHTHLNYFWKTPQGDWCCKRNQNALFPHLPDEATVSIPLGEVPLLYSLSEWALDLSSNLTIVRGIRVRTAMQWMRSDRKR